MLGHPHCTTGDAGTDGAVPVLDVEGVTVVTPPSVVGAPIADEATSVAATAVETAGLDKPDELIPDPAPPRILQMELPNIENTTDVVEGGADNVECGSSVNLKEQVTLAADIHAKPRPNLSRRSSLTSVTLDDHSIITTGITTELFIEYGEITSGCPDFPCNGF
jgi:hypothetical protein